LAFEAEVEIPVDPKWAFGHFRLVVGHESIGDWGDAVTLAAVAAWWRGFTTDDRVRWDSRLTGLPPEELYSVLDASVYGEAQDPIPEAHARFDIGHLGMSAWARWRVFFVEQPNGREILLWTDATAATRVASADLPTGALKSAAVSFVAALAKAGVIAQ
jgi:hypothetical protein